MKKTFKSIFIVIISLIIIASGLYFLQQRNINNFMIDYWFPAKGKTINNYKIIRCDFKIYNPIVAFISDQVILDKYPEVAIYFSEMENTIFGETKENYLGATTIKNTTFDELVKMVKEDCSQFQEDYTNPDPNGIDWGYREAEPPEPPKTEEDLELEKKQEYYSAIRGMKYQFDNYFTDLQQDKFTEFYGDINSMTNDEIYHVVEQLRESGDMVDESIKQYFFDEDGNLIFRKQE